MVRTKAELIDVVAARTKLARSYVATLVNGLFDCMTESLRRGEGIEIRGFGSFTIRSYRAYAGRNPRSGEPIQVEAKRLAFFRVGKHLRMRINAAGVASAMPK